MTYETWLRKFWEIFPTQLEGDLVFSSKDAASHKCLDELLQMAALDKVSGMMPIREQEAIIIDSILNEEPDSIITTNISINLKTHVGYQKFFPFTFLMLKAEIFTKAEFRMPLVKLTKLDVEINPAHFYENYPSRSYKETIIDAFLSGHFTHERITNHDGELIKRNGSPLLRKGSQTYKLWELLEPRNQGDEISWRNIYEEIEGIAPPESRQQEEGAKKAIYNVCKRLNQKVKEEYGEDIIEFTTKLCKRLI